MGYKTEVDNGTEKIPNLPNLTNLGQSGPIAITNPLTYFRIATNTLVFLQATKALELPLTALTLPNWSAIRRIIKGC